MSAKMKTVTHQSTTENSFIELRNNVRQTIFVFASMQVCYSQAESVEE
jgi:hypothetical protein